MTHPAKISQHALLPATHSPHAGVHLILVEVISKAVLVGAEGLVAAVDVDGACFGVVDTTVPVPPLYQGTVGLQDAPGVGGCRK